MEREGSMLGDVFRLCAGLFESVVRDREDPIACGGNCGMGFPISDRETDPALTFKGRMPDVEVGGLGTCTITVALGVFSLAVNSLRSSSESMSVSLSKVGPFLNSGVVRFPMKDVTSYWVPAESTFMRDMLPGLLPASSLLRPGESGIGCGVVGYSFRIGILGGSNPATPAFNVERRSSFL